MAKNRYLNTKFWTDNYVINDLDPIEKLAFIYLITNPYTNICGIYELPIKVMAIETGIDRDNLEKAVIPQLVRDGKIFYKDGWVAIKNFIKHQTVNPSILKGISEGLAKAPQEMRDFIGQPVDSLSQPVTACGQALSNLNLNLNLNLNKRDSAQKCTAEPEKPWIYQEKWDEMIASGSLTKRLIALFWKKKGFIFSNGNQFSARVKRDCKAAKRIAESGYSEEQIVKSFKYVMERYGDIDWKIETVEKSLEEANK